MDQVEQRVERQYRPNIDRREVAMLYGVIPVVPKLECVGPVHPGDHRAPVVVGAPILAGSPAPSDVEALCPIQDVDDGHLQIGILAVCASHARKRKAALGQ